MMHQSHRAHAAISRGVDGCPRTHCARNIRDEGERSAFGLPSVTGVLVVDLPAQSALAKAGLRKNDVILSLNGGKTPDTKSLMIASNVRAPFDIRITRNEGGYIIRLTP